MTDSAMTIMMNAILLITWTHCHAGGMETTAMTGNNTQKHADCVSGETLTATQTQNATEALNAKEAYAL